MSDVTINYKGSSIATMDASGTKTLLTEGKYCEDDIEVVYVSPGGGGSSIEHIFTYIPASYSNSAELSVGDYVVDPSRLAIFLMSDNSVNDPTYETMVGGYSCYVTKNNILNVNSHNPRGFQVTLKANSGNDFWNSTFNVSQNGTTITVNASRNYKPGAEYTFFFYDLNADL